MSGGIDWNVGGEEDASCAAAVKPLTTTFTPPTACATSWATLMTAVSSFSINPTLTDYYSQSIIYQDLHDFSSCYPPNYLAVCVHSGPPTITVDSSRGAFPTFSPGICPHGYTTALQSIDYSSSVTYAACCTPGFDPVTEVAACTSTVTTIELFTMANSQWTSDIAYTLSLLSGTEYYYTTDESGSTTVVTSAVGAITGTTTSTSVATYAATTTAALSEAPEASPWTVMMPIVWVAFKEGELKTSASAGSSRISSSSVTTTSTISSAPASPTQTGNSSLSTGAKAGIGIGVVIGALAILGILAFWVRIRKRRTGSTPAASMQEVWTKSELSNQPLSVEPMELPGAMHPSELQAMNRPHELDAR